MKYRCITRAELPAVGSREHALNEAATRADYFFRQTNGEYRFPAPDGQVSQLIEMLLAAANMPPETVAPAAVPEGWQLVPVEPTDHMSDVGMVSAGIDITENDARHVYSAMLDAAPQTAETEEKSR